ncbi:2-polyprenylphenol hydroxylase [Bifidobacterium sp. DSM 109958]|uniref:2-polyprenylphenol hydroxylase n=1 Tax=Bifidobacterium moraviense TaxID=2675323 RepID=A0A7Y0HYE6_9BIFI|nr:dihydroorotate dehydrogenase electron transfer subunit [Bifidobacterium sp. DSM 109958]NMM99693.1 2-polyprenylphenol hydroxylase [Bifidobacterium sp. DSM 109958]
MTTPTATAPSAPPAADIVAQATAAGFFPPRHPVRVTRVDELVPGVTRLAFRDPYVAEHARPAQFVDLFSPDPLRPMPRPFGVSEVDGDEVSVIFAVIGKGTADLARLEPGDMIDVLGPLGRPFNVREAAHYVLVGGGLGVPPLIHTAQRLADRDDVTCTAVFGYRNEHFADRYVGRYADTTLSIDESEGNVITLLDRHEEALLGSGGKVTILSCGPLPMMKAVASWAAKRDLPCQLSMEQHMGCGYGTCVLCTVDTVDGRLKVCSDGPVFTREQLGWE